MQPEAVSFVRDLQPQCAAMLAVAAAARHVVPANGDHVLTVNVGGGLQAEQLIADIMASAPVTSGRVAVERAGPTLEFISDSEADIQAVAAELSVELPDNLPEVADALLLVDVSFDYANQFNRGRNAALLVPGDSLLFIELAAGDPLATANGIERDFHAVRLVNVDARSKRLILKGLASELARIREQ